MWISQESRCFPHWVAGGELSFRDDSQDNGECWGRCRMQLQRKKCPFARSCSASQSINPDGVCCSPSSSVLSSGTARTILPCPPSLYLPDFTDAWYFLFVWINELCFMCQKTFFSIFHKSRSLSAFGRALAGNTREQAEGRTGGFVQTDGIFLACASKLKLWV